MKTRTFKIGDKVMKQVGGNQIYCVEEVKYQLCEAGDKPNVKLCFLALTGEDTHSDKKAYFPSALFRLIWSGHEVTR
jgi:hypothetical protein